MAAAVVAMPAPEPVPDLYEHPSLECVECLGCGEMIEIPYRAVLEAGREAVDVKRHPENRLLWLELMALDHRHCHEYHDVRRAREARARAIRKPRRAAGCVTPIRRGGCARPSAGSC